MANTTYLGAPALSDTNAHERMNQAQCVSVHLWQRRGTELGWVGKQAGVEALSESGARERWANSDAVLLPGFFANELGTHAHEIEASLDLMEKTLEGIECIESLEQGVYPARLHPRFEILGAVMDEGDPQEIEKVEFDAMKDGEIEAENLWMKASWLSFDEEDISLRYRFSFGMEKFEDVSGDYQRELIAAELAEAIFPESRIISGSKKLKNLLRQMTGLKAPVYVERIMYFNAPNGGAQFHQDVERGHAGVIFAQLHGSTGWFALPKQRLIEEILAFLNQTDADAVLRRSMSNEEADALLAKKNDHAHFNDLLETSDDALEKLLNRTPEFFQQLVAQGYAYILEPGDAILLPQESVDHCAWHSVFCLDDFPGFALSFAIRDEA